MERIDAALAAFSGFMWGPPLVVLLVGGGLFFTLHSRLLHFRYFGHSLALLRGKYNRDSTHAGGDTTHYRALATALAGTMGLGNITGVALAIMYRGRDDSGKLQGGPMYVIREGLGPRWLPLAWMFAIAGMVGTLPVFQINQLVQILRDLIAIPAGLASAERHFAFDLSTGIILMLLSYGRKD